MRILTGQHIWREKRGSTTVLALMISMMLMVLVTAAMAMTMIDVQLVFDHSRNRKAVAAADSGIVRGDVVLDHALSNWHIPPATTVEQVDTYATDAEEGDRTDDRDVSLIADSAPNIEQVFPRDEVINDTWKTETNASGLDVGYTAAVDIVPTAVDRPASNDISHTTVFHYDYTIEGQGNAQQNSINNQATRQEEGSFEVEVQRPSFSTYGYFTNSMKNQFDQQLVFYDGEVYSGPTHVNAAPPEGRAGFYGQAVFNGPFSAVQERYEDSWLGGNANPLFNAGATWGAEQITLPPNGWSQMRAALGDMSNIETTTLPTNMQQRVLLNLAVNNNPIDDGVYYSKGDGSSTANAGMSLNGGLYIKGSPSAMALSVSGGDQVITVTMNGSGQYAGSHTWEIHDNKANKTSYVKLDGAVVNTFNSNLNGMIHVEGNILGLGGDSSLTSPDVQSQEKMTISATGHIYINTHITYQDDPRLNANAKNILGIFSSGGNIYLAQGAPSDLTLHASVMATGAERGVGAEGIIAGGNYNYSYPDKGFWNLLGGLIENKNQTTGVYYSNGRRTGYRWNFTYDDRFQKGVAPPYFPYVTKFVASMRDKHAIEWRRSYYN